MSKIGMRPISGERLDELLGHTNTEKEDFTMTREERQAAILRRAERLGWPTVVNDGFAVSNEPTWRIHVGRARAIELDGLARQLGELEERAAERRAAGPLPDAEQYRARRRQVLEQDLADANARATAEQERLGREQAAAIIRSRDDGLAGREDHGQ
jgi:hypothetical protein